MTLRTNKLQKIYKDYINDVYEGECIFCQKKEVIKEYSLWTLSQNEFPYDKIAKTHYLLSTKRHIQEQSELNSDEIKEFNKLLELLDYDMCILNKKKRRSAPIHFHYHLITLKD